MSAMTPLVSICLPNLNTRPFLQDRMDTLLAQTFPDWELIICDSYSNDGSWEFFQTFRGDRRIQMFQAPRAGTPGSWNYCVERARGQYVYVATSDDTSYPTMLEKLVAALEQHPDVEMASCNFDLIDEKGRVIFDEDIPNGHVIYGDWLKRAHRRYGLSEFVASCVAKHVWTTITAVLFRRSLLAKTSPFPANRGSIGDYEWALRASLCTDTVHVPETLATWRIHRQQATKHFRAGPFRADTVSITKSVLSTFADRLPAQMRTPETQSLLLWPRRVETFNRLQLHPRAFLQAPLATAHRLLIGLREEPGLTLMHLIRGARWTTRPQVNPKEYTGYLLERFHLPAICQPLSD